MKTGQNHPHHCYSVGEHILHAMKAVRADRALRLAMCFHDIGKPCTKETDENGTDHFHGHAAVSEELAKKIMYRLKFDTDTIVRVTGLVRNHDRKIEPDKRGVRRAMAAVGTELFPDLLEVKKADIAAQSTYQREEKYSQLETIYGIYFDILRDKECVCLKDLAVTGRDLLGLGIPAGPELGALLKALLGLVVEDPACNTKEYLLAQALRIRESPSGEE